VVPGVRPIAPSGEQIEIALGDQRAVVAEVGAGLRAYAGGGRALIDGYEVDRMSSSGRGQLLIPWPNRVQDGVYEFDGERHQLPLTQPDEKNAIHGLVRWRPWAVREREPHRVVMGHMLHPQPGYPFTLELSAEYGLSEAGLHVRTTAVNLGSRPCPYGSGAHPYLTAGSARVDATILSVPAATVLRSDRRGIPTGRAPVDGTEYDYRRPRPIGATQLDHCFTDLVRDDDGVARVVLRDGGEDGAVALWVDDAHSYLMLFTGDPLPDVDRRSLAVEPMTCPPNAFRTGEGLVRLEPGESFTSTWGIGPG
jgi:aldose 1-epimerase